MTCVYRHTSPSGKVYIGITKNKPELRWRNGLGYYRNPYFYKAIEKYGWDNFKHEILIDGLTDDEALQEEKRLISLYRSNDPEYGYNLLCGPYDLERRKKSYTPERRAKAHKSWLGEKNPNARSVICLETLTTYKTVTEAQQATGASKICDCCKRLNKHRTSGGFHWAYYDASKPNEYYEMLLESYIEEESRPQVFDEKRRRDISERCSVAVICVETGVVYKSLEDAAQAHNLSKPNLCSCCKGRRRTAGGYHWAYYDSSKDDAYYADLLKSLVDERSRAYKRSDEYLARLSKRSSKPVRCIETGVVYHSQKAASEAVGIHSKSDISACCKGRQHTAGGYHWEYADKEVTTHA